VIGRLPAPWPRIKQLCPTCIFGIIFDDLAVEDGSLDLLRVISSSGAFISSRWHGEETRCAFEPPRVPNRGWTFPWEKNYSMFAWTSRSTEDSA